VNTRLFGWTKFVLAGISPAAVSAAWIPARNHLPNTDLALLLVLVIGTAGWLEGMKASLVGAVVAGVTFDVIDTRPYGAITMSRGVDLTTALTLVATGLLVGSGASRLARYRKSEDDRTDALAVVMEASGLVATGGEYQLVTGALRAELLRALALTSCEFHAEPPNGTRPSVARDGSLVGLVTPPDQGPALVDLPIWSQGDVVAHYRLRLGSRTPTRDELRMALGLADQAGAAMAGLPLEPPTKPRRSGRLRLLPSSGLGDQGEAKAATLNR
jgi:uncharacterized membrane protein (UPF0136 family)